MAHCVFTGTKVLLLGLEASLAAELSIALGNDQREFRLAPSFPLEDRLRQADYGVIFCNAERQQYTRLLESVRRLRLPAAVIVVTRMPNPSEWLDALEAGAADYCSPPFEAVQIRWLLENKLRGRD